MVMMEVMGAAMRLVRLPNHLPRMTETSRLPPAKATATSSKINTGRYWLSCDSTEAEIACHLPQRQGQTQICSLPIEVLTRINPAP